jgi:cytochrome c-type biogenesis protein
MNRMSNAGNRLLQQMSLGGTGGQFFVGAALGMVWSPCVGPTLGAASLLAAQGKDLVGVAAVMLAFGFGTALPLLLIAALSRQATAHWRGRLLTTGQRGKLLMGVAAITVAGMILTGTDREVEIALVNASPAWLTDLTTHF